MVDLTWLIPLAGGVVRSVVGWSENALADGKISAFEWTQLGSSVLRVGMLGFSAHFGFGLGELEASGIAVLADFLLSKLSKK